MNKDTNNRDNSSNSRWTLFLTKQVIQTGVRMLPVISDHALLSFGERFIARIPWPEGRDFTRRLLLQAKRQLPHCAPSCRQRGAVNFIYDVLVLGTQKRIDFLEAEGFWPPFLIVISPTTRCNLRCYGCYASSYAKNHDLPHEVFDRVLTEAEDIGIYFVTISGGEPFIREDLLDMFARHENMYFQVYTNGTLIDRRMAGKIANLGNVLPAISVEGLEKETDERRGRGVFKKVCQAMDDLREAGALFGFSVTATRQNTDVITSDEFIDFFVEKGCFLGWYFNYIPIGRKPELSLMPTPEQRVYRWRRMNYFRRTRPILISDFWNDGPCVGGCMAAGKEYLHINVNGDVEPCVFVHFAVDNVKEKSLREILKSDFFTTLRSQQPFDKNLLRPCMIIDHPQVLREAVRKCGARPTHPGAETIITELGEFLDGLSRDYGRLADIAWAEEHEEYQDALLPTGAMSPRASQLELS